MTGTRLSCACGSTDAYWHGDTMRVSEVELTIDVPRAKVSPLTLRTGNVLGVMMPRRK